MTKHHPVSPINHPLGLAEGTLAPGVRVGGAGYILKRMLGRGSLSEVWLAWDRKLEHEVALKFLPQSLLQDPNLLEHLKREAERWRQLDHPGIARVYGLVQDYKLTALATEYVDGWSLAALKVDQPEKRYGLEAVTPWVRELCAALDYAHNQAGILHLALRPTNLVINICQSVMLTDFGIAWTLRRIAVETDPNRLAATLGFLSPQLALGEAPSVLDDVYGLGATIYDLLTGTPPFYKGQVLAQVCERTPPSMTERLAELGIRDSIPPVVEDAVALCLAKEPAKRPQSISEVLKLLERSELPAPVESVSSPGTEEAKVPESLPSPPPQPSTDEALAEAEAPEQIAAHEFVLPASTPAETGANELPLPANRGAFFFAGAALGLAALLGICAWLWVAHGPKPGGPRRFAAGSLDSSFNAGTNSDHEIRVGLVHPDGKILVGGSFTRFGGGRHRGLARLNADGSLDENFRATTAGEVHGLALQSDGKIIIAGEFVRVNQQARRRIARLTPEGTLDESFSPNATVNGDVWAAALQPDGKIVLAGSFELAAGQRRSRIARFNPDGTVDGRFNPGTGAPAIVWCVALQPDGKIIAGGDFMIFDQKPCRHLVRLNADGSVYTTFASSGGTDAHIYAVAIQDDGKILIGGDFIQVNKVERNRIARLNADGTVDPTFNPAAGPNGGVRCLALQSDGKILIGGIFTSVQGVARHRIARLKADGSLDAGFDPGEGASEVVRWIGLQPDGRILIAGGFKRFAGAECGRIARLQSESARAAR